EGASLRDSIEWAPSPPLPRKRGRERTEQAAAAPKEAYRLACVCTLSVTGVPPQTRSDSLPRLRGRWGGGKLARLYRVGPLSTSPPQAGERAHRASGSSAEGGLPSRLRLHVERDRRAAANSVGLPPPFTGEVGRGQACATLSSGPPLHLSPASGGESA